MRHGRWVVWAMVLGLISWSGMVMGADKEPAGKTLFLKNNCNTCHSIAAASIAKKAASSGEAAAPAAPTTPATSATPAAAAKKPPDLSGVGLDLKVDAIQKFLLKEEKLEGRLHPKKFRGTKEELTTLAAWLETMKTGKEKAAAGATPKEAK